MKKIEEIVKKIRERNLRCLINEMVWCFPNGGRFISSFVSEIFIDKGSFYFEIRILGTPDDNIPQEIASFFLQKFNRIFTSNDCISIETRTFDGLKIILKDILPQPVNIDKNMRFDPPLPDLTIYKFKFQKLFFPPDGSDALTSKELAVQRAWPHSGGLGEEEFFAIIPDAELKIRNTGLNQKIKHPFFKYESSSSDTTCFFGTLSDGKFCFEQKVEGGVEVRYSRLIDCDDNSSAENIFQGILDAFGYTHGDHPWPYFYQYKKSGKIIERWSRVPLDCSRDCLLPIRGGVFDENDQKLFHSAAEFFAKKSKIGIKFTHFLWLMREGNKKDTACEVRVLVLCSILEGLLKQYSTKEKFGTKRLPQNIVDWKTACDVAGLKWENWLEKVHNGFCSCRNSLAHGFDEQKRAEEPAGDFLFVYSRIIAAIYIIMAKEMRFQGEMFTSQLEEQHIILC